MRGRRLKNGRWLLRFALEGQKRQKLGCENTHFSSDAKHDAGSSSGESQAWFLHFALISSLHAGRATHPAQCTGGSCCSSTGVPNADRSATRQPSRSQQENTSFASISGSIALSARTRCTGGDQCNDAAGTRAATGIPDEKVVLIVGRALVCCNKIRCGLYHALQ